MENIEVISSRGATVYAPTPKPRTDKIDRYAPKRGDSPTIAAWRVRSAPTPTCASTAASIG